jgi:hypothetical protein
MTLLGFKTILHKKCRSGKYSEGPAENLCAPPKIGKYMIFRHKIMIFHTKYPKNFVPPSAIGKNMIFWRKIVIFHTKYPNKFCTSLRLSAPPRVKNHNFMPKNHIFPNFRGGAHWVHHPPPPPGSAPVYNRTFAYFHSALCCILFGGKRGGGQIRGLPR